MMENSDLDIHAIIGEVASGSPIGIDSITQRQKRTSAYSRESVPSVAEFGHAGDHQVVVPTKRLSVIVSASSGHPPGSGSVTPQGIQPDERKVIENITSGRRLSMSGLTQEEGMIANALVAYIASGVSTQRRNTPKENSARSGTSPQPNADSSVVLPASDIIENAESTSISQPKEGDSAPEPTAPAAPSVTPESKPAPPPAPIEEEEDVCCICLDTYSKANPKSFGECFHHFHTSCIEDWKKRSIVCPMCCEYTLGIPKPKENEPAPLRFRGSQNQAGEEGNAGANGGNRAHFAPYSFEGSASNRIAGSRIRLLDQRTRQDDNGEPALPFLSRLSNRRDLSRNDNMTSSVGRGRFNIPSLPPEGKTSQPFSHSHRLVTHFFSRAPSSTIRGRGPLPPVEPTGRSPQGSPVLPQATSQQSRSTIIRGSRDGNRSGSPGGENRGGVTFDSHVNEPPMGNSNSREQVVGSLLNPKRSLAMAQRSQAPSRITPGRTRMKERVPKPESES